MRDLERLLRIAVPSVAAILAGAGVLIVLLDHPASSASRMAEPAESAPITGRPCEQQAWPHIDRRCLSVSQQTETPRKVRLVTTDRLAEPPVMTPIVPERARAAEPAVANDVIAAAPASQPAIAQPAAQIPIMAPVMAMTETHKPAAQKPKPAVRTAKRERHQRPMVQRSYEVPATAYDAPHPTRRVTVTSPSRFDELLDRRF